MDGKAFGPGGGNASALIPDAFGLAGVKAHAWTAHVSAPPGEDRISPKLSSLSPKLSSLHFNQLSLPSPKPQAGRDFNAVFHDGRFAGLDEVVSHFDSVKLGLSDPERRQLRSSTRALSASGVDWRRPSLALDPRSAGLVGEPRFALGAARPGRPTRRRRHGQRAGHDFAQPIGGNLPVARQ